MTETSLEKLEQEALGYPEKASGIIVHSNETLNAANEFLKSVKGMIKEIKDAFSPMKKKAKDAHTEIVAQEKRYLEPLIKAEGEIKLRIGSYMEEQERKAEETRKKAQEEEEKRLAAAQVMMEEAAHMEDKGQVQEAQDLRSRIPEQKSTPVPVPPKLEGTHISRLYKWEVTDLRKVPVEFLMIDRAKVTAYVNAHKERANIPGIRIYTETNVSARA
jgi:hypothetical protein